MLWFRHDSNANTDDKLQSVLLDYGLEGYGLYWYCLELIVNRVDKDNINFELKHDARIIARNTGSTVQKVEEMMRRFVELGLFEGSEGRITCIKLIKRMDTSMTSNLFMRKLILEAKKRHNTAMISHDTVMTNADDVMKEYNTIHNNIYIPKKVKTSIPKDFSISERIIKWANKKNHFDLDKHLENFIIVCQKQNYKYVDWDSAFMDAIRKNWADVKARKTNAVVL